MRPSDKGAVKSGRFASQDLPQSPTFGQRLRTAGVSHEDRQDLLDCKSDRITMHYSAPVISRLIQAPEIFRERRPDAVLRDHLVPRRTRHELFSIRSLS